MFIYAIGSKEEEYDAMRDHTSVIGRTSPGCSLELLADVCQDRMKDRLFAAKRMPILAIVNFIPGGQERRYPHALGRSSMKCRPGLPCVI